MPIKTNQIIKEFIGLAIVFLGSAWFLSKAEGGYDLWWQLAAGLRVLNEHRIVLPETFAFTGLREMWVNHEWGAELLFALAYNSLGWDGLAYLRALIVVVIFTVQYVVLRSRGATTLSTVLILLVVSGPILAVSANCRPQTFALALFSLTLALVYYSRHSFPYRDLLLPMVGSLLLVVWVSIHGSVLLGVATLLWGALIAYHSSWRVFLCAALFCLALLLQPFGTEYFIYLAQELTNNHRWIVEWYPLRGVQWGLWAFLVLPLSFQIRGRALFKDPVVLPTVGLALITTAHARFLPFLMSGMVFLWAPLLDRYFASFSEAVQRRILGAVCVITLIANSPALLRIAENGSVFTSESQVLPRQIVAELKAQQLPLGDDTTTATIALPLEWGGYALYHLSPSYRVSVDGRNVTAYKAEYVEQYIDAWVRGDLAKIFKLAPANLLLCKSRSPIAESARSHPHLLLLKDDGESALFKR